LSKSAFWFVIVGTGAALTHMAVFVLAQSHIWPELANALGFAVAFVVSFVGHRRLSFADSSTRIRHSLPRFALTALAGFASNEAVFVALWRGLALPAMLALIAAMLFAAGQTFVLSRFWAFRR
jgi:putative flippase GtrA